jgi:hypothetical protein
LHLSAFSLIHEIVSNNLRPRTLRHWKQIVQTSCKSNIDLMLILKPLLIKKRQKIKTITLKSLPYNQVRFLNGLSLELHRNSTIKCGRSLHGASFMLIFKHKSSASFLKRSIVVNSSSDMIKLRNCKLPCNSNMIIPKFEVGTLEDFNVSNAWR